MRRLLQDEFAFEAASLFSSAGTILRRLYDEPCVQFLETSSWAVLTLM